MKHKWNVPTFYFLKGLNKQMLFSIWVHSYYNQYLDKNKNSTCTAELFSFYEGGVLEVKPRALPMLASALLWGIHCCFATVIN